MPAPPKYTIEPRSGNSTPHYYRQQRPAMTLPHAVLLLAWHTPNVYFNGRLFRVTVNATTFLLGQFTARCG